MAAKCASDAVDSGRPLSVSYRYWRVRTMSRRVVRKLHRAGRAPEAFGNYCRRAGKISLLVETRCGWSCTWHPLRTPGNLLPYLRPRVLARSRQGV